MTLQRLAALPVSDDELGERFAPVFEKIAAGAVERERNRALPFDEIRLLKEAGFGALRVPIEFGGLGATLHQTFDLLIGLGGCRLQSSSGAACPFQHHRGLAPQQG